MNFDYNIPQSNNTPNQTIYELKIYRTERRRMIIPKILGKFEMLISQYHKRVIMYEWIAMPNHVHLLIELGN
ncbi:MAG: hypothetical protein PHE33_05360 [Bacteroidales bacterium]|nr:hypothetical protein [Bacteroidales bacterium]